MSQSAKLQTITPTLRQTTVVAPSNASTALEQQSVTSATEEVRITSDRAAPIDSPGTVRISLDKSAAASVGFFSLQNLLTFLPGWTVSFVGHGAVLVLLAVVATSPLYDKATVRLDALMVDSADLADAEDIENITDELESDLLKVDVAALNSEASEVTTDIVRDDGFEVSLMEGFSDGIGMEAMANTGLTPIETVDQGGIQGNTEGTSTQFFGTEASGSRFVFIIDGSGSMTEGFRWHQAVRELQKSIGQLSEKQEAMVLVYNFETWPMFDTPPEELKLLPVTKEFKKALGDWLAEQTPAGGTRPAHALSYSLTLQPDAIFLLSDGMLADNSIQVLAQQNRGDDSGNGESRRVPIHTVSLGPNKDGAELMKFIADHNDGEFNWVR